MDQADSSTPQRGAPRLSRLPLPRATVRSMPAQLEQARDKKETSRLPRFSGAASLRTRASVPQSEASESRLQSTYGWNSQQTRSYTPTLDATVNVPVASLEATPPSEETLCYVEGDENSTADRNDAGKSKRRPRPSLSERTVETLAQIPPSPSPSRKRPSITAGGGDMRPPSRTPSSLRTPRSNMSLRDRSLSPSKQGLRIPSRNDASAPAMPSVPLGADSHRTFTQSKDLLKVPRTAVVKPGSQIRRTSAMTSNVSQQILSGSVSFASKAKTVHNFGRGTAKNASARPSLESIFQDPPKQRLNAPNPSVSLSSSKKPRAPLASPQPPKRDSGVSKTKKSLGSSSTTEVSNEDTVCSRLAKESATATPPKSSMALRETIAKAKAARREAVKRTPASHRATEGDNSMTDYNTASTDGPVFQENQRTLQKRIEMAITTGSLNIAAMDLKNLPLEILKMYDFNQESKVNWSEAVDLTKLIAADNELEDLSEDFFPDWSIEELQNDEDKTNHFGGLEVLNIRGNLLKSIPIGLRQLGQLHSLDLNNNALQIGAFDVIFQITSLRELSLANNKLQGAIPSSLANLHNLQILDLHSNRLSTLPDSIASLPKLQKLDLSDNAFVSAPVEELKSLSLLELNLSKNSLTGTFFSNSVANTTLQILNVASNSLNSLCDHDFDLPSLQSLASDNNQLRNLPDLSLLRSLTSLSASENKIQALPYGLTILPNLRSFNLSANQIKTIDPLISNMESLISINIAANPLRERKYLAMSASDLKTDLAKRLLVDNSGSSVGSGHTFSGEQHTISGTSNVLYKPERGVLHLSAKGISLIDLSTIDLSQPIHTIRLSNNDLTEFPSELLVHSMVKPFLKSLDFSHNQLLDPTAYMTKHITLPVLESLYVVSTGLTSLDALMTNLSAPLLKELNISCHRMTGSVPHVRNVFPQLTTLLATDNWFTSVETEHISGLEVLDIRNNDIDHLPPKLGELGNLEGSTATRGRLRVLECSGNKFRVPRQAILERGTEAVLRDLRRMVPTDEIGEEWRD